MCIYIYISLSIYIYTHTTWPTYWYHECCKGRPGVAAEARPPPNIITIITMYVLMY